jgi:1-acyl-sn-glycerol-3-phosphate acyltransferase
MTKVKSLLNKVANFFYNIPRILFINFYKLFIRLHVFNIKNIPENGPAILAINHVTGADPIIILGAIKKQIYFLAESENFKVKILKAGLQTFL